MTGNTQIRTNETKTEQINRCDNIGRKELQQSHMSNRPATNQGESKEEPTIMTNAQDGEKYWQMRYDRLKSDYDHLQTINQNLEEKLLSVVDSFEKKREEMEANAEYEKSTLMADVNKLSTKLVDARMKLHDREEKDIMHAAECDAPCHIKTNTSQGNITNVSTVTRTNNQSVNKLDQLQAQQMLNDPNLV